MVPTMKVEVAVFAHNEERNIARSVGAILAEGVGARVHILANGCSDRTVELTRSLFSDNARVIVHDIPIGDKSNAWNLFVHEYADTAELYVFSDGDCEVCPGSLAALVNTASLNSAANAISALPRSGRKREHYAAEMTKNRDLAGNLYALTGQFVKRIREQGLRLPVGLVGDDSIVGAWAKMDLVGPDSWDDEKIAVSAEAGFTFDSVFPLSIRELRTFVRRLERYARRGYEIQMLQEHHRQVGLVDYPVDVKDLYRRYADRIQWRSTGMPWFAERAARAKIRGALVRAA